MNSEASATTQVTCTTDGETTFTATFTNPAFTKQTKKVTTPALGHDWKLKSTVSAEPVINGEDVCTDWKVGNNHYECSRCHETKNEVIKVSLAVGNAAGEEEADMIGVR